MPPRPRVRTRSRPRRRPPRWCLLRGEAGIDAARFGLWRAIRRVPSHPSPWGHGFSPSMPGWSPRTGQPALCHTGSGCPYGRCWIRSRVEQGVPETGGAISAPLAENIRCGQQGIGRLRTVYRQIERSPRIAMTGRRTPNCSRRIGIRELEARDALSPESRPHSCSKTATSRPVAQPCRSHRATGWGTWPTRLGSSVKHLASGVGQSEGWVPGQRRRMADRQHSRVSTAPVGHAPASAHASPPRGLSRSELTGDAGSRTRRRRRGGRSPPGGGCPPPG